MVGNKFLYIYSDLRAICRLAKEKAQRVSKAFFFLYETRTLHNCLYCVSKGGR